MAFPTSAQLTDFSGGAETPISEGGTWLSTSGALVGGADANRDASGVMTNSVNWEMRRAETVGPNIEIWGTLSLYAPSFLQQWFVSGSDYYRLEIDGSNVWHFYKTSDTQLGANLATQALSNGDAIGWEYVGGILRAYHKPAAGSWAQIGTDRSDSLLQSSTGYLALSAGATNSYTDFGGSTASAKYSNLDFPIFALAE